MSESTAPPPTRTRTPLVITSFPTVPLTTTFTRPTDCGGIYAASQPVIFVIDNEPSCLPPDFSASDSSFFYSPGIACPSGYWTACHDTTGVSSITTVTCCPTYGSISLTCVSNPLFLKTVWEYQFCTWIAPKSPGTVITVTVSSYDGRTSTITPEVTAPGGLNAPGVRMVYQASDMEMASSSTSSVPSEGSGATVPASSTPDSTGTSLPGASNDPDATNSDSGLSTGEQAAIGVVVPLVVIALLVGLALWWRRRKRQQQPPSAANGATAYDYASGPAAYQPAELAVPKQPAAQHYYYDGQPQAHEMPTAWIPPEMPNTRTVVELPGQTPTYYPGTPDMPR
ncbi:hypothetical protein B0I37DRAFT_208767 [Chaetomium sp. MPI-CAGE-AT-0009]|nr:hypothetical protein B0I37DRAFT_208767 [Chaetomium sp. MPI-CAGE-AT-0009]